MLPRVVLSMLDIYLNNIFSDGCYSRGCPRQILPPPSHLQRLFSDGKMFSGSIRVWIFGIIKIYVQSSCDIEDFVETHFCKLGVILRSRVLLGVCPH